MAKNLNEVKPEVVMEPGPVVEKQPEAANYIYIGPTQPGYKLVKMPCTMAVFRITLKRNWLKNRTYGV